MPITLPAFSIIYPPHKGEWALWASCSLLLLFIMWHYPQLDLQISQQIQHWHGQFRDKHDGSLWSVIYYSVPYITALYMLLGTLLIATKSTRRAGAYLISIMTVGAGLIVNAYFKEFWGRPRPWYVLNDPSSWSYIPPLSSAGECVSNCSFPSGDVAAMSCLLAISFFFSLRPRIWIQLAICVPISLVAFTRMVQGSHFLTDVLASICIICGLCLTASAMFSRRN